LDNDCDGSVDEGLTDCCQPGDTRPCGTDVGVCEVGVQTCEQGGTFGVCDGVLPTEEVCDGLDNDCNGETDDGLTGEDCPLQAGVCAGSTRTCGGSAGWQACSADTYGADYEAEETRCDGLDNDCDGQIDNGLEAPPCPLQQGVCWGAAPTCTGAGGWAVCDFAVYGPTYQQEETTCDALDNDCDGSVDEGLSGCCEPGAIQPCGSDVGACERGVQTCQQDGSYGLCDGVMPTEESCDGVDNDCDGLVDEIEGCSGSHDDTPGIGGHCGCGAAGSTAGLFAIFLVAITIGYARRKTGASHARRKTE
jgi:hypothetical protein